jgi:hypothetical protein
MGDFAVSCKDGVTEFLFRIPAGGVRLAWEYTDYAQWGIAVRKNLDECVELAEKYGLSSMTMDEIDDEVRAARVAAL